MVLIPVGSSAATTGIMHRHSMMVKSKERNTIMLLLLLLAGCASVSSSSGLLLTLLTISKCSFDRILSIVDHKWRVVRLIDFTWFMATNYSTFDTFAVPKIFMCVIVSSFGKLMNFSAFRYRIKRSTNLIDANSFYAEFYYHGCCCCWRYRRWWIWWMWKWLFFLFHPFGLALEFLFFVNVLFEYY